MAGIVWAFMVVLVFSGTGRVLERYTVDRAPDMFFDGTNGTFDGGDVFIFATTGERDSR